MRPGTEVALGLCGDVGLHEADCAARARRGSAATAAGALGEPSRGGPRPGHRRVAEGSDRRSDQREGQARGRASALPVASPQRRDLLVVCVLEGRGRHPLGAPEESASSRSEEHTSELQSLAYLVCRLLLEKKKKKLYIHIY